MSIFWIFWGTDVIVAVIAFVFFVIGLNDGSVSGKNIALWLGIFVVLVGVLFGGWALRSNGYETWAVILLGIIAVPALLYGLFLLLTIILKPDWR